jgi:hypothetical protein
MKGKSMGTGLLSKHQEKNAGCFRVATSGRRPEAHQPSGESAGAMAPEKHLRHLIEVGGPMLKGESNSSFNGHPFTQRDFYWARRDDSRSPDPEPIDLDGDHNLGMQVYFRVPMKKIRKKRKGFWNRTVKTDTEHTVHYETAYCSAR